MIDELALMEREEEEDLKRLTRKRVFNFGIIEAPVYVRASLVIPGYHAHWIVRFYNYEHGVFVKAEGYAPPKQS